MGKKNGVSKETSDSDIREEKRRYDRELVPKVKNRAIKHFGKALASRISMFVPFPPFRRTEELAIIDVTLEHCASDLLYNVDHTLGQHVGNIRLCLNHNIGLFTKFIDDFDDTAGVRGIQRVVQNAVYDPFLEFYHDTFDDSNPKLRKFVWSTVEDSTYPVDFYDNKTNKCICYRCCRSKDTTTNIKWAMFLDI